MTASEAMAPERPAFLVMQQRFETLRESLVQIAQARRADILGRGDAAQIFDRQQP